MSDGCKQAWPGGLSDFMWNEIGGVELVECIRPDRHTGKHSNGSDLMWWGAKLDDAEMARADMMRAAGLQQANVAKLVAGAYV